MVFGYSNLNNRNVIVRFGSANRLGVAQRLRGIPERRPEVFRPGIKLGAFAVRNVRLDETVTWKLRSGGRTAVARATVRLERDCIADGFTTPDVAIEKTVRPSRAAVGDRVTYTVAVENVGKVVAQSVTVVDRQLEERVQLLSATSSRGRCELRGQGPAETRVVCFLGNMQAGERATIVIAGRALRTGTARNRATALTVPPDFGENNTATVRLQIGPRQAVRPSPPFTG